MAGGGAIRGAEVGVETARIVTESIARGMPVAVPALKDTRMGQRMNQGRRKRRRRRRTTGPTTRILRLPKQTEFGHP